MKTTNYDAMETVLIGNKMDMSSTKISEYENLINTIGGTIIQFDSAVTNKQTINPLEIELID